MTKAEIMEKAKDLINAPSCYPPLKAAVRKLWYSTNWRER